ncbi:MAG: hypothetical protein J6S42_04200 [Thermoguttaceae bacterium]|nr:hypothetical protein [Thermoguttaceae bacterium]MCR5358822.1 hypothetical protein [Thermoguttaceae bacterium]
MQKIVLCVLTFAALCLSEWAYAQPPGGGRHHRDAPVMRGQALPPPMHAAPGAPHHGFGHDPGRHHAPPPPPPPKHHQAPPPPPPRHTSFLQVVLPFLSFGLYD